MTRPLHIVQISRDASLLRATTPNEAVLRQMRYAAILERNAPGSRMTILVCVPEIEIQHHKSQNLEIEAVTGSHAKRVAKLIARLIALQRKSGIDVAALQTIFDEGSLAAICCVALGIRVVGQIHFDLFNPHNTTIDFGTSFFSKLRFALGKSCLKLCYSVRVVGEGTKKRLLENKLHWRVSTIPIGTYSDKFKPADSPPKQASVLFVGRLVPIKRVDKFLRIAKKILEQAPQTHFNIVGDGPERDSAQALAQSLGIDSQVTFHGYVPNDELPRFYQAASVYVLTSDAEGFGRTLVESYRCGTPAVAGQLSGVEDIVSHDKSGFLVSPNDEEKFAQKVSEIMSNPALRAQFSEEGERLVKEKFAPERLAESWVNHLQSAARSAPDCVLMPRKQTFTRWKKISFSPYSMMRALQYDIITGLTLKGRTLDVGGGTKNSYYHLLNIQGEIESINIDPAVAPTHIGDLNKPLSLADAQFDNLISLNTFEHVQRDAFALKECLRLLKPGGSFYIVVPFLYQVHGSPCDYNRRTHFWWVETLEEYGIPRSNLQIEPIVWDRASTGLSLAATGLVGRIVRPFVLLPATLKAAILEGKGERMTLSAKALSYTNAAIGYFITGHKPKA